MRTAVMTDGSSAPRASTASAVVPAVAPATSLGRLPYTLYFCAVVALTGRIAYLDGWDLVRYLVLAAFLLTVAADIARRPRPRSLALGVAFFFGLSMAVTYLPELWFGVAFRLNHAKHYLLYGNDFMRALPGNDAAFLWSHPYPPLRRLMAWVYENGFDMVVWIPILRSLAALDALKMARYALAAHLIQFPLIMPFYTAIRVDEVWSVLGHPDMLQRGWDDETRLDLGANCFPSMHTSVAFAVLLLALREKSRAYRAMMIAYAVAIILSTMFMQVHWVLDVAGGLLLGWGAVRIVDRLLRRFVPTPTR